MDTPAGIAATSAWAAWDAISEAPIFVMGQNIRQAQNWIRQTGCDAIVVANVPIGIHTGTLYLVGTATRRDDYTNIVKIARANGLLVVAG